HPSYCSLEFLTIATIAEQIAEGSVGQASITTVKSVSISISLLFSLLSGLSELVTFFMSGLSAFGTLGGSFSIDSHSALFSVASLFLVYLGVI
ncbi:MAG: hypothetical protein ACYS17_09935, partial [Planctomycetota bacterium]